MRCPVCGDDGGVVDGELRPVPDPDSVDISVCLACATVLRRDPGGLRVLTDDERAGLTDDERAALERAVEVVEADMAGRVLS